MLPSESTAIDTSLLKNFRVKMSIDFLRNLSVYNSSGIYIFNDNEEEPVIFTPETRIVPALFLIIFVVGLIGNGLLVYIVVRHAAMRTVTNLYLVNLSVVDILFLVACVPLTSVAYGITDWPFGDGLCKFVNYTMGVCLAVSVMTLAATGLDRYYAIIHPVRSRTFRTSKRAMAIMLGIWVASVLIMVPRAFLYGLSELWHFHDMRMFCNRHQGAHDQIWIVRRKVDSILMFLAMFLLPQVILSFCHCRIVRKLWTSVRPGSRPNDISLTALRARRKIAKIIFAITVAFGVGWLPIHIVRLHEDFIGSGNKIIFKDREVFALCFSYGANAINPIIYCLLSGNFRYHFKMAIMCKRHPSRRVRRFLSTSQRPMQEIRNFDVNQPGRSNRLRDQDKHCCRNDHLSPAGYSHRRSRTQAMARIGLDGCYVQQPLFGVSFQRMDLPSVV
ncbi:allatostatin-A receptor-like [Haliotis cracherodii]|uniref:allatostatin-A receptor-like n=1 Tax=Haliotis cracherodii TaxID=6455 RepID=UPI0039EA3597